MEGLGRMERRSKEKVDCVQGNKIWKDWGGWERRSQGKDDAVQCDKIRKEWGGRKE